MNTHNLNPKNLLTKYDSIVVSVKVNRCIVLHLYLSQLASLLTAKNKI